MPETNISTPQMVVPQPVAPESEITVISHRKVVEALVKYQGLHEGIWGLFVRFGLGASNVGENDEHMLPAAIVPVVELGLQRFSKETSISVDAAKVNPRPDQEKGEPRPHK